MKMIGMRLLSKFILCWLSPLLRTVRQRGFGERNIVLKGVVGLSAPIRGNGLSFHAFEFDPRREASKRS
jgi:hypothetical protein